MVARDITDNQNAGTRAILDFLTQSKIQSLEADNQALASGRVPERPERDAH